MSWNSDKILAFIREFKKRPLLWKKDDKRYNSVGTKEEAWREISEVIGESPEVLKRKMESLRSSRRREKSRIANSLKTSTDHTDIYVPRWFAWESLKFLEDSEEIRASSTNNAEPDNEEGDGDTIGNSRHCDTCSDEEEAHQVFQYKDNSIQDKVNSRHYVKANLKRFRSKKKRKRAKSSHAEKAHRILKKIKNDTAVHYKEDTKNDCTSFGNFIAEKLRMFESRQRAVLQHEMHNLIFHAEMSLPCTSQSFQFSSSSDSLGSSHESIDNYKLPSPEPSSFETTYAPNVIKIENYDRSQLSSSQNAKPCVNDIA